MSKVIVIGGGAAGMMAAIGASSVGHQVIVLEQNEKLGKKIYITGKGRCNFTNASSVEEMMAAVVTNPKFLYSAFYTFSNESVMDFFEKEGVPYKVERGNRVFPVSDHSSDIIRCLEKVMQRQQVQVRLSSHVKGLLTQGGKVIGVQLKGGKELLGDHVILATGGRSYPTTGSCGDGYAFAEQVGHTVTPRRCALVPLVTRETYIHAMQGLSLKNVKLSVFLENKVLYENFGELLFTHFGISGPLALSASSYISGYLPKELSAVIDMKPALSPEMLDDRLLREINNSPKTHVRNLYKQLLPSKMVPVISELSGLDDHKQVCELTREERQGIARLLKAIPFTITATAGWKEAIITQGGVAVGEVDPSTMESKIVSSLSFAGEVLDLDALTGGYNLQIAWSTGYLAGINIR